MIASIRIETSNHRIFYYFAAAAFATSATNSSLPKAVPTIPYPPSVASKGEKITPLSLLSGPI
ncbi:hypothetical protein LEP1GSC050_0823 [Leptospira broomii serovar Hurstbridge str. 5399]|uniref:Uncharacterized protein n=1 Tax=Leptospira broomii serovar Hurstbridge str. 5399 TaxID=1049789 RepID=T0FFP9_9LEPT|nr:hypothetical protein LEP1GSC050_0823 [Leptospira broomii serovar Hurstbridge str. 5399]